MKYPEGTTFEAEPEAEFQKTTYLEVIGFNSHFDESEMEPNAEYHWTAYNEEGEEVESSATDATEFDEWADEAEVIDDFPWR